MKNLLHLILIICIPFTSQAQKNGASATPAKPKLVVGIVVDQMRWDYLYRFSGRYSNNGFKRMIYDGFTCENTVIPYTPTYTAAGHTCIYTGSVPAIHGIMGNNWYDRQMGKVVYCTDDSAVSTVGSSSVAGKMSPANLWTTTITDELRISSNLRSKVVGIALKDRGAILPAGHAANAAFWFDNANGAFISSTFYMKQLPEWVNNFNNKKLPDHYLSRNWNTLFPIDTYANSTADNKSFESNIPGEDNTFPHITANITNNKYNALRYTPYGNTLTAEMAKAAVEGEGLGQSGNTDFLTVSFSSTDYIGHEFGPNSVEAEDTYLRLDNDLASLLTFLDNKVGKGEYLAFLTADHGAANIPAYLKEIKVPAGAMDDAQIQTILNETLQKQFNINNAITKVINYQVYLNHSVEQKNSQAIRGAVIEKLLTLPAIASAFELNSLNNMPLPADLKNMVANGYNQKLSGDIQFVFKPQWFDGSDKGTTHGAWFAYDAHIPLLWYGWGVKKGKTNRQTYMTDISATLAAMLHIQMPSGCIGRVIEEVVK